MKDKVSRVRRRVPTLRARLKIKKDKMENSAKTMVYVAVALVVGLAGGYYLGSSSGYSSGYEEARVEVKTRLEERRIIEPVSADIRVMSGTIRSIGSDRFELESRLPFDPTLPEEEQGRTVIKTVLIGSDTQISTRVVESNTEPPKPGEPFSPFVVRNVKIGLGDLKVSDAVTVEASENIADKSSFEAVSVFRNQ